MIDDYRNLLYLTAAKHKEIGRARERHVILRVRETNLDLRDFDGGALLATNGIDALYRPALAPNMTRYNRQLLKVMFDWEE